MQITRRGFLGGVGGAALALGSISTARAAGTTIGFIYVGSKDDYGWNQSHAVAAATLKNTPGITVVEEENVPETLRGLADHGIDDQHRRGFADFPDLVRLLQSLHARRREEISEGRIPPSDRALEQRQGPDERGRILLVHGPGPLREWRRGGSFHQDQQDRLHRGQADRPRACATSIPSRSGSRK